MNNMTMRKQNTGWKLPSISTFGLKMFACVTMLICSIGASVVQDGIIHLDNYTQAELMQAMETQPDLVMMAGIASSMQIVGGLAVPIFAFLLVEGFRNTSDFKKYLLRLSVLAIVSEVPFDLAMQQTFFDFSIQNPAFGIAISLLMLYVLDLFKDGKGAAAILARICIVVGALVWVTVLRVQFGPSTVLLAAIFYLFYARNVLKTLLGILVSLFSITGPLSFYLIWLYSEEQKHKEWNRWFYVFYPAHFLILGVIVTFLMK